MKDATVSTGRTAKIINQKCFIFPFIILTFSVAMLFVSTVILPTVSTVIFSDIMSAWAESLPNSPSSDSSNSPSRSPQDNTTIVCRVETDRKILPAGAPQNVIIKVTLDALKCHFRTFYETINTACSTIFLPSI
ncbi:MAG: hypothetical protein HQK67_10575 [Desulfamplus sp.]|nr:hypothetical protein [Desulfamplus sp.]